MQLGSKALLIFPSFLIKRKRDAIKTTFQSFLDLVNPS